MANLGGAFNPDEIPASEYSGEPIPAGVYDVQIVEADVVPTKSGDGERLTMRLNVVSGPHEGRPIFEGLNIRNANPTAQSIAQRTLADICIATGAGTITDTDELLYKPFKAKIGVKADAGYEPRNVLKRVIIGDAKPAPQAKQAPKPAPSKPKPAAGAARPWAS